MNQNTKLYDDIILINSKLYGYLEEGSYYIASYDSDTPVNNLKYNYLYSYNDVIFTIHDKKVEILDSNMKNTLLMSIHTFYEYNQKNEINTLNINIDNNLLFFDIIHEDKKYIRYIYDLKNKKLL